MKKLSSVISALLLVCLAAGILTVAVPKFLGAHMFAVLTPSMEPELSPGDLVYAFPADFGSIQKGDIISFVINEQLTVATHRVADIDRASRSFTTKGDANETEDGSPVKYENVVGVVRFSIPAIGRLAIKFSETKSKIILISAVVALAALSVILNIAGSCESKKIKPETEDGHGQSKK